MSLTTVTNNLSITIPKTVRDNLGLAPFDCISIESDDLSYFANRVPCETPRRSGSIDEAPTTYDVQMGNIRVSRAAEITLPTSLVKDLQIEPGSVVGLFRDTVGYRFVHLYTPSRKGMIDGLVGQRSGGEVPGTFDHVIMEYSVQVTKETRGENYYGWQQSTRLADDEAFSNVDEPAGDVAILDSLPLSTATNRH